MLVLRLRAAYLALFTLGFSEILRATISAEIDITRGQAGIELPHLFENGVVLFGYEFTKTEKIPPYFIMFFLLLACLAILAWLAQSRFGLFIRALREDEDAAAALGINIVRYKVLVFVITCTMAALAGGGSSPLHWNHHSQQSDDYADEPRRGNGSYWWSGKLCSCSDWSDHN